MLTCKEVSFLASKKLDKELSLRERIGFLFHTAMCRLCINYAKDLKELHAMMLKAGKTRQIPLSESSRLSEKSRKRIQRALEKALNQTG